MFHARPHPAQVDRRDSVEDLRRLAGGTAGWNHNPGIVERHIEPAERIDGHGDHGRHAVLVGHVTTNTKHLVAGGCQLLCGRTKRGLVDVCDYHRAPASANARAVAKPMPELPPVTSATWPVKS